MNICPPSTTHDIEQALADPGTSVYLYVGQSTDLGWTNAQLAEGLLAKLEVFCVSDAAIAAKWTAGGYPCGIAFGWNPTPSRYLSRQETEDLNLVLGAVAQMRGEN